MNPLWSIKLFTKNWNTKGDENTEETNNSVMILK